MNYKTEQQRAAARKKITDIERSFEPASDYNKYIFDLYLRYIRRNQVDYNDCTQASKLKEYLETSPMKIIRSWSQIKALDLKNPLKLNKTPHLKGYVFKKIGHMLVELGVFDKENIDLRIENLIHQQHVKMHRILEDYLADLSNARRSKTTLIANLYEIKNINAWMLSNTECDDLLNLQEYQVSQYLDYVRAKYKPSHLSNTVYRLNYFYRWCINRKITLHNPIPDLKLRFKPPKHTVVSKTDFENLRSFIKRDGEDPQLAMLIALTLFFGLTIEQMTNAQFFRLDHQYKITFKQVHKSYKSRSQRSNDLIFPDHPQWLLKLLLRFHQDWTNRSKTMKQSFARHPLFIHDNGLHNMGVSKNWLQSRFEKATTLATGHSIPFTVLRQTCGILHKNGHDASALQRLGWAQNSAFIYTWAPVTYFTPKSKTKN